MAGKAQERDRDHGKETVFLYGGLRWNKADAERRVTRSKKSHSRAESIVGDTPSEIDYHTPGNATSPETYLSPSKYSNKKRKIAAEARSEPEEENELSLRWCGHSREELISIFEEAKNHAKTQSNKAEELFATALEGYEHLVGSTHEETVKVAFAMASFYTEQGRSEDADRVIEEVCRRHIVKYGIDDRRTVQTVLKIVEVLNAWNRGPDALAFLAKSKHLAEEKTDTATSRCKRLYKRRETLEKTTAGNKLQDIAHDLASTKSTSRIDYGIGVARAHVAANDSAVEGFLRAIIQHCDAAPETFETQKLKARSELLKFYTKNKRNLEQRVDFMEAAEVAKGIIRHQKWVVRCFKSFETMEALLELSASLLKGSFEGEAWDLFNVIEHKAEDEFGWDDERTIWGKISIGIIYENTKGWSYAKDWFSHAYAASSFANGDKDGITMALEVAFEKCHFTYLTDEGRPFKTVFGVNGLTFRPVRLHID